MSFVFLIKDKIFYKTYIQNSALEYRLDPLLIFSVITEESRFNNKAVSNVGAVGLMQLMPKTSREIAKILKVKNFSVQMLTIPEVNIRFGSYYLKQLIGRYDGNLILALSAYNAGIGIADGWIYSKAGHKNTDSIKNFELNDIQYKSTKIFVRKVLRDYRILKKFKIKF
jgi:soluble lytic murein transglycosylase